jgi:hypothetical protein
MIKSDNGDERSFSENQVSTRIDAFMEIIKERKEKYNKEFVRNKN